MLQIATYYKYVTVWSTIALSFVLAAALGFRGAVLVAIGVAMWFPLQVVVLAILCRLLSTPLQQYH